MPIARVAGCSTRAGRLKTGPAGKPHTKPSAMTFSNTVLPRGSVTSSICKGDAAPDQNQFGPPAAIGEKAAERNGTHRHPQHDADDRSCRRHRPAALDGKK